MPPYHVRFTNDGINRQGNRQNDCPYSDGKRYGIDHDHGQSSHIFLYNLIADNSNPYYMKAYGFLV